MRDYMELGDCPAEEDGEALGYDRGDRMAHREQCRNYIALLEKMFGPVLEGSSLAFGRKVMNNGEYAEVVAYYDSNNLNDQMICIFIENNLPATWKDSKVYSMQEFKDWLKS